MFLSITIVPKEELLIFACSLSPPPPLRTLLRVTTFCTFAFENSALAAELILFSALKKQVAGIDTSMADLLVT
jgi:hypothetical protein